MDVEPKSEAEDELVRDDPMNEDSANDTIDIFFTPSIDAEAQLSVLQFPLRPYDLDDLCEEVKLNPENLEVEIDLPIDLDSINIDKEYVNEYNVKNQSRRTPLPWSQVTT